MCSKLFLLQAIVIATMAIMALIVQIYLAPAIFVIMMPTEYSIVSIAATLLTHIISTIRECFVSDHPLTNLIRHSDVYVGTLETNVRHRALCNILVRQLLRYGLFK